MKTFILPGKLTSENLTVNVPFSDMIGNGEIVIAVVVTITVYSGIDPTPANVLLGVPTIDATNTIAIFTLTGGVSGVTYIVAVQATGSSSNVAVKEGYLTVIPTNPF